MKKNNQRKKTISELSRLEREAKKIIKAVRKNTGTAILAAFAFVIALVWRDAIQQGVNSVVQRLNIPQEGYLFTVIAAIIVTIVCVLGILLVSRWAEKK